jgi:hypothetical protein
VIIGLGGYARSGKDTVARILVEERGFVQVAYADILRDMLYALNPILGVKRADAPIDVVQPDGHRKHLWSSETTRATIPVSVTTRLRDVIDKHGWDGYKKTVYCDEIRGLIQRLGTEGGRELLGNNIWVGATIEKIWDVQDAVISDVRFQNEHSAVKKFEDGQTWWVERPGVEPANAHASENTMDSSAFDKIIRNDGSIDELKDKVLSML